ncbi:MAG: YkgJ family cysteine cluster protein [Ilumatobacteraceae bacterium]
MTEPDVVVTAWLAGLAAALRGEADSDVACGTCTACCRSQQFIHIEPDEADALAHIPSALRFPAPGMPQGHVLMGYDERGSCPMLGEHGCTIYAHRPRTCRVYDCRVFAVAGVFPDEPEKADIAARARRWQVVTDGVEDEAALAAVHGHVARLAAAEPDLPATPLAVRSCRAVTEARPVDD